MSGDFRPADGRADGVGAEPPSPVAGAILAGGSARRMGGCDKTLLRLAGRPILEHIVDRLRPQVAALVLNANGDPGRFAPFGIPVVPDTVPGLLGPLAGILAVMDWVSAHYPDIGHLVTVPCDTPLLPDDLVDRLADAPRRLGTDLACAVTGGRRHPVVALWPVGLRAALRNALVDEGVRKVDQWASRYRRADVRFDAENGDPLFNINSPEDMAVAEALLTRATGA